jgi:glycosyltransferase involved in cell wall biosynthesis
MTSPSPDVRPLADADAPRAAGVSLIVCTRNRAAQLGPCLEALSGLRHSGPWELILVDNGSTDGTDAVLKAFVATAPVPACYVFEPVAGLARARNTGVAAASGEVVAFTDDDCYVAPDLIDQVAAAFADPAVGYAGGRILLHDPQDARITIMESTEPQRFPPRSFLRTGQFQGANMAFRRAALQAAGGFDTLFGAGSYFPAEDIDALAAVSCGGWTGVYAPGIVVSHHHRRREADVPALSREYDRGRGAYHMKLLLKRRAIGWFLRAHYDLAKRFLREPRSAVREMVAGFEYAMRQVGGR